MEYLAFCLLPSLIEALVTEGRKKTPVSSLFSSSGGPDWWLKLCFSVGTFPTESESLSLERSFRTFHEAYEPGVGPCLTNWHRRYIPTLTVPIFSGQNTWSGPCDWYITLQPNISFSLSGGLWCQCSLPGEYLPSSLSIVLSVSGSLRPPLPADTTRLMNICSYPQLQGHTGLGGKGCSIVVFYTVVLTCVWVFWCR